VDLEGSQFGSILTFVMSCIGIPIGMNFPLKWKPEFILKIKHQLIREINCNLNEELTDYDDYPFQ